MVQQNQISPKMYFNEKSQKAHGHVQCNIFIIFIKGTTQLLLVTRDLLEIVLKLKTKGIKIIQKDFFFCQKFDISRMSVSKIYFG